MMFPSPAPLSESQAMGATRCCGTGNCIINAEGCCWCGQRWDGETMCFPTADPAALADDGNSTDPDASSASGH